MVSIEQLNKYCNGDITKIENYEKAVSDPDVIWECHHRLEEQGYSAQKLIKMNRYYKVPPEELKLMTPTEHRQLHMVGREVTDEQKRKMSKAKVGEKNPTKQPEVRRKISKVKAGREIIVRCLELNKTFYSYAECNREIAEYLGLKSFNVGKVLKRGGHYRKYNLTFIELTYNPNQLELEL